MRLVVVIGWPLALALAVVIASLALLAAVAYGTLLAAVGAALAARDVARWARRTWQGP